MTSILQLRHCQRTRAHTRARNLQNKTIWMQNQVIVYQSHVGCYQNNGKWQTSRWKTKTPFILMRQDGRKEREKEEEEVEGEKKRMILTRLDCILWKSTWKSKHRYMYIKKERLNKPLYIRTHNNTHAHNVWRESSLFFYFSFYIIACSNICPFVLYTEFCFSRWNDNDSLWLRLNTHLWLFFNLADVIAVSGLCS